MSERALHVSWVLLSSSAWAPLCHTARHRAGALRGPAHLPGPKEMHHRPCRRFSDQPQGAQGSCPACLGPLQPVRRAGGDMGRRPLLPALLLLRHSHLFAGMVLTSLVGRFIFLTEQHTGVLPSVPCERLTAAWRRQLRDFSPLFLIGAGPCVGPVYAGHRPRVEGHVGACADVRWGLGAAKGSMDFRRFWGLLPGGRGSAGWCGCRAGNGLSGNWETSGGGGGAFSHPSPCLHKSLGRSPSKCDFPSAGIPELLCRRGLGVAVF